MRRRSGGLGAAAAARCGFLDAIRLLQPAVAAPTPSPLDPPPTSPACPSSVRAAPMSSAWRVEAPQAGAANMRATSSSRALCALSSSEPCHKQGQACHTEGQLGACWSSSSASFSCALRCTRCALPSAAEDHAQPPAAQHSRPTAPVRQHCAHLAAPRAQLLLRLCQLRGGVGGRLLRPRQPLGGCIQCRLALL